VKQNTRIESSIRMSFVFPLEFYELLQSLKLRYNKDMTYIIIDAVNDLVIKREGLKEKEV